MQQRHDTRLIILAAGKGKRMGADIPKVLTPFNGKAMILHLLEAVSNVPSLAHPIVVVGHKAEDVKETIQEAGHKCLYALQQEQLGTGHAVAVSEDLWGPADTVMVLYGDHPLVSSETIETLLDGHQQSHYRNGTLLTMATIKVDDFADWRKSFYDFGRIIRDEQTGQVLRVVERKDATAEELEITEVNPSYFIANAEWLRQTLRNLRNENSQKEYYLTDIVLHAVSQEVPVSAIEIPAIEGLGVNTPEQLELVSSVLFSGV